MLTYILVVWALICVGLAFEQSSVLGLGLAIAWIAVPRDLLHHGSQAIVSRRLGMRIVGFGIGRGAYVALNASDANTPRSWASSAVAGPATDLFVGVCALLAWLVIGVSSPSIEAAFFRYIGWMQLIAVLGSLLGNEGFVVRLALSEARPLPDPVVSS